VWVVYRGEVRGGVGTRSRMCCVINYTYLYHHIVVLDRYTNSNLVYYKHNEDDETYDDISVVRKFEIQRHCL